MERLAKLLEDYKEAVWQHSHSFTEENQFKVELARQAIIHHHMHQVERARKAPRVYSHTIWGR